jgi:ATP-dependent Clp protease ATP-binding subunit ClpA
MIQMLDSGILTDSRGHSVSFRHTVVVLSADIDPTLHTHTLGFSQPSVDNTEHEILSDLFSAELLLPNREKIAWQKSRATSLFVVSCP